MNHTNRQTISKALIAKTSQDRKLESDHIVFTDGDKS
jgi:hypothetical protein